MSMFDFIKKLLPSIERSNVEEDLRTTEKELSSVSMPSWDAAAIHFKSNKIISTEVKFLEKNFYTIVNIPQGRRNPTFVSEIAKLIQPLHQNTVKLQAEITDKMDKVILRDGLTVRTTFLLRSASNISMVSRFLLSLLNYIYTKEAQARGEAVIPALDISKAEARYIEENFVKFAKLFSQYTIDPDDFGKLLGEMPDSYINDKTKSVLSGVLGSFDPFAKTGMSGFAGSPIYALRLMVAEWQHNRYESAKAKKQQLELRLLYLQNQAENKNDPVIEREILRLQDRIEKIDRKIHETEEDILGD